MFCVNIPCTLQVEISATFRIKLVEILEESKIEKSEWILLTLGSAPLVDKLFAAKNPPGEN